MKNTKIISVCAVICALSTVLLLFGSVTQIMDLTMVALCSMLVTYSVIEIGGAWPWLVWAVTSLLSLLLLPDKFGGVVYLIFGGYYPMAKLFIEKRTKLVYGYLIKLVYFNMVLSVILLCGKYILLMPDDEISLGIAAYVICNPTFILFDFALTRLITVYLIKFQKRFGLKIKK